MKRYQLQILAVITVIAFLAAVITIATRDDGAQGSFAARMLFPDLEHELANIDRIRVTSFGDEIILARHENGWLVESSSGYNANAETINNIIKGVTELRLVQAKTRLKERHDDLGLGVAAIGLKISAGDEILAHVLIGSRKRLPAGGLPGSLYVLLPDGDQTWLAETNLDAPSRIQDWLDPTFPMIINERVRKVVSQSPEAEIVTLLRDEPGSAPFKVADIVEGYRMKYASVGNRLGSVLAGLRFEDVMPRADLDFSASHRLRFITFDGMTIEAELIKDEYRTWLTLDFTESNPILRNEGDGEEEISSPYLMAPDLVAADIERFVALTGPWAYQIPSYKGADFMLGLDDLVEAIPDEDI